MRRSIKGSRDCGCCSGGRHADCGAAGIGFQGRETIVEGVLDTGFNGFLCLPIPVAITLGLVLRDTIQAELADGTVINELVFAGRAEWDGAVRDVRVILTRSEDTLIGTAFLADYRVQLDYSARTVQIERASQT
jgi:clan AA aspartic protease